MKKIFISIIVIAALAGGMFMLLSDTSTPSPSSASVQQSDNVSMVGEQQIIQITAKGGYSPRQTTAKANVPTTIKVVTNGTYDCSSVFTIPSLKYRSFLPPNGTTDVPVGAQPTGSVLKGVCGMGMYNFQISFK